jgi:hypothetical protein
MSMQEGIALAAGILAVLVAVLWRIVLTGAPQQ